MKLPRVSQFKPNLVNVLNLIGALVIISLVVTLGQTIMRNYTLNKQIIELRTQINRLQDQRDELAYNIEYYKTESFQQREARAKLGLQLPGEQVVVLPRPSATPTPGPDATKAIKKKSNFQQWLDFLAGNG
jgi:cell division protein FtsB